MVMLIIREERCELGKAPGERPMEELLKYGIAVIDKPPGPSSHEVSAFVRKILHLRVTGHTGTLDQKVSGVLVVLLEESRKILNYIPNSDKTYVCLMRLSGEVPPAKAESAFSHFRGEIYQRPPLQSAVAKKLRKRKIHELKILECGDKTVLFECRCEAGTYIRKLVFDVGEVLGVRAEMLELRRTDAGEFPEARSVTLQQLSDFFWAWKEKGQEEFLRKAIIPLEAISWKKVVISDEAAKKIRNGVKPKIGDVLRVDAGIRQGDSAALFTGKGELIAVAGMKFSSGEVEYMHEQAKSAETIADILRLIHEF